MDPRALNDSQGTDLHAPSHDNGTTSTAAGGMQPALYAGVSAAVVLLVVVGTIVITLLIRRRRAAKCSVNQEVILAFESDNRVKSTPDNGYSNLTTAVGKCPGLGLRSGHTRDEYCGTKLTPHALPSRRRTVASAADIAWCPDVAYDLPSVADIVRGARAYGAAATPVSDLSYNCMPNAQLLWPSVARKLSCGRRLRPTRGEAPGVLVRSASDSTINSSVSDLNRLGDSADGVYTLPKYHGRLLHAASNPELNSIYSVPQPSSGDGRVVRPRLPPRWYHQRRAGGERGEGSIYGGDRGGVSCCGGDRGEISLRDGERRDISFCGGGRGEISFGGGGRGEISFCGRDRSEISFSGGDRGDISFRVGGRGEISFRKGERTGISYSLTPLGGDVDPYAVGRVCVAHTATHTATDCDDESHYQKLTLNNNNEQCYNNTAAVDNDDDDDDDDDYAVPMSCSQVSLCRVESFDDDDDYAVPRSIAMISCYSGGQTDGRHPSTGSRSSHSAGGRACAADTHQLVLDVKHAKPPSTRGTLRHNVAARDSRYNGVVPHYGRSRC